MAQASAGEVLVTSTTRDLTLDGGFEFEEKGTFELKGVPGTVRLYRATGEPTGAVVSQIGEDAAGKTAG